MLTSGASESVPDVSEFARGLKMALEGNTAPQIDPLMLYDQVRLGMRRTTPLFGELKDSGHQVGGSFLFFLKDAPAQVPSPATAPAEAGTAAAGAAVEVKPTFTVEKPHATIVVTAREDGRLFLDAKEMGSVPAGGTARLERLDVGSHTVSMLFEGDQVETKSLRLKAGESVSLAFGELVRDRGWIPRAVIRIDGSFDDWAEVRPLFLRPPSDTSTEGQDLKLARVSLARDHEYLYVRYDVADQGKPTFFRPHNFNERSYSEYQLVVSKPGSYYVALTTGFDVRKNAWSTYAAKGNGKYTRLGDRHAPEEGFHPGGPVPPVPREGADRG